MSNTPVRAEELRATRQVDGVIRVPAEEFVTIPAASRLLHVNAMPCTHVAGGSYLLAMICGRDPDGVPLLDAESAELVTIDETRIIDRSSMLAQTDLDRLIGRPGNHEELHELLARRYAASRGVSVQSAAEMPLMVSSIRRMLEPS